MAATKAKNVETSPYVAIQRERKTARFDMPAAVSVEGAGHDINVTWSAAPGANDVAVDSAVLHIAPSVVYDSVPSEWPRSGGDITVKNATRVHSLTLDDLASGDTKLASDSDLAANNLRLVVSIGTGGPFGAPAYAVPHVAGSGVMPASFTGASYKNRVLTLPDVAATKIRLSLVPLSFPSDVSTRAMSLGGVHGVGAKLPRGLTLTDADGATAWAFPGEWPENGARAVVDLTHAVEKLLKPKVKAGQPLTASFKLKGTGSVFVTFSGARGAVLRSIPGVITTELAGDSRSLQVPPPPLPSEVPSRAIGEMTVKYHGIRVLETIADAVPLQSGAVAGVVVSDAPVIRKLAPAALEGMSVAKIGIIGRAPVDCELVVQLFDVSSGSVGAAITQPASVTLAASSEIRTVWLDVPKHDPIRVPAGVSARTNHGRFLWASAADPLLRIAIFDDDPGGRAVRIAGSDALFVHEASGKPVPINVPVSSAAAPVVESLLFSTVDVSDLTLEYDR